MLDRETNRDLLPSAIPLSVTYVASITNVLSDHLGWHRARLTFMARFVRAVLTLRTTDLWRIATTLKAGVQTASNHRRIQRFLAGYDLEPAPFGRLLVHLAQVSPPYLVTLDRTEWHVGSEPVNVLVAGISLDGEVALPIAWTALPKKGGSSATEQITVLDRLLQVVGADQIDAVVADREFISAQWLKRLEKEGVSFAVRVRSDRRLQRGEDGACLPVRMVARTASPGRPRVLENIVLQGEDGSVTTDLVIRRMGGPEAPDPFLILATQGIEPDVALSHYAERWSIETLFAALKSRGFDLEATRLTAPERVERLIALLALAFLWARLVGEHRAKVDGPPRRLPHGRRHRSLFRYGLDRLQHLLATPEETRGPLLRCLQLLRSPAAFLSCT